MALSDVISNLGEAIIGIFDRSVDAHSDEVETELLKLKARIDALVSNNAN